MPVAAQRGHAVGVTGLGVERQRTASRAGKRVIAHDRPALDVPRAFRGDADVPALRGQQGAVSARPGASAPPERSGHDHARSNRSVSI